MSKQSFMIGCTTVIVLIAAILLSQSIAKKTELIEAIHKLEALKLQIETNTYNLEARSQFMIDVVERLDSATQDRWPRGSMVDWAEELKELNNGKINVPAVQTVTARPSIDIPD